MKARHILAYLFLFEVAVGIGLFAYGIISSSLFLVGIGLSVCVAHLVERRLLNNVV